MSESIDLVALKSVIQEAKKVAKHFADMFYGQNNRFDYNRFYSACNVNMIKL